MSKPTAPKLPTNHYSYTYKGELSRPVVCHLEVITNDNEDIHTEWLELRSVYLFDVDIGELISDQETAIIERSAMLEREDSIVAQAW